MSHEERNTVVSLVTSLVINAYFLSRIWAMFHDGTSTAPNGLQIWAQTMLWVVPVAIVGTVALIVLASIADAVLTGEKNPIFLVDERDRKFQLWALGATMAVMVAGFLTSMILLALGYGGFVAFTVIYLGFALGDITGSLVKLGLYRCGV